MPTLILNGTSVPFQPGETILEAARTAGFDIPTLCWYPKLPIVGNCRICLVSVQGQNKLLIGHMRSITSRMLARGNLRALDGTKALQNYYKMVVYGWPS